MPREPSNTGARAAIRATVRMGARRKSGGYSRAGASESAVQIVFGVGMAAWKAGASLAQDGLHLVARHARAQQVFSDPKVGDAPIQVGKPLREAQAPQPSLIESGGASRSNDRKRGSRVECMLDSGCRPGRYQRQQALGGLQQRVAAAGQVRRRVEKFHPGSQSAGQTPLWFLIFSTKVSLLKQLASKEKVDMRRYCISMPRECGYRPMPIERFSRQCPSRSWLISLDAS